jgi:hypothetical protein
MMSRPQSGRIPIQEPIMKRCIQVLVVASIATACLSPAVAAQPSQQDGAAYQALLGSPIGNQTPIMVNPGIKGERPAAAFAGRFSSFQCEGCNNNFGGGITAYFPAGSHASIAGTAGYLICDSCDPFYTFGVDVHSALWNSAASPGGAVTTVNLQGSLGYGMEEFFNALSAAVSIPIGIAMPQENKSRIGTFISPGFGWGRMSNDAGDSESGTRPMIGAGASWTSASGWGVHAGFQKIIIEDGGNILGVSVSRRMPSTK